MIGRLSGAYIILILLMGGCATIDGEGQLVPDTALLEEKAVETGPVIDITNRNRSNDFHLPDTESSQYYELKIAYLDKADYEYLIREKIRPLVGELEADGLIQGFHFIMHGTLDLRLAVEGENLSIIADRISAQGIPHSGLKPWTGFTETSREYQWYGPAGIKILLQTLEANSRLVMDLFHFKQDEGGLPLGKEKTIDYLNHQLVHYFLIQQGIDNLEQVHFSLDDAKFWVDILSKQNNKRPFDPTEKSPE